MRGEPRGLSGHPSYRSLWLPALGWVGIWYLLEWLNVSRVSPELAPFGIAGYVILGLASGAVLFYFMRQAPTHKLKQALVIAYLVVTPIAAFSALQGPLIVVNPWWNLLVMPAYGIVPLAIAVRVGAWIVGSSAADRDSS